jgi:thiopeptide-type bacteriocin biosynthesis protein
MIDYTAGFFVLRTPLLPFEEFLGLSQALLMAEALRNGGGLAEAAASDRKLVRSRLQEFVRRPEIQEALWIASPEFFESLSTWWNKPESEKGQKIEQSLYRYVARMISRSTPFGLFASCATGEIGNQTRLELGARETYWRRSRLDMEYLCNLADKISSDPALRSQLRFRPNTSLYLAAGRYHHAQSYYQDKMRLYRLVATEPTHYLNATLERASGGATPQALAQALIQDEPDIPLEEAEQYVGQLIESQVLVAELAPPITGPEPIDDMIEQLKQAEITSVAEPLTSISSCLREIDKQSAGVDLACYKRIVEIVSQLPATFKAEHLIQVDAMKPAPHACLDQRLISDILRGVETLHTIIPGFQPESLKEFKDQFQERYEGREMPLFQVLDEEVGIGFERKDTAGSLAEPLLEGIDIVAGREEQQVKSGKSEFILLRKLEELLREGSTVLSVDKKLIDDLRVENPLPLPDAFAVMGAVLAQRDSSPAKKNGFYLQGISGPSGANLLGRFCHAHDRLKSCVEEYLHAEEKLKGDAVFAEIVHLPEGRVGNVLFRPILRGYEIPFLATSRMTSEKQIPVSDLMVSLQEGRIVLRSRRLGREVLPRMTTAHGYSHPRNLKLYKFLCLLQLQGVSHALGWNWGVLDQATFLPRVVFGHIIFSMARWKLTKEVIEQLSKPQGADRLRAVEQWREKNKVPRFVYVTEADNQLLIDFENALSVEVMVDYIKKRPEAKLVEMLHDPANLPVRGPEGSFVNEVVIPFVRNASNGKPRVTEHGTESKDQQAVSAESAFPLDKPLPRSPAPTRYRSFLPGSEWLYAKIYLSPSHMDRLLLQTILPLVQKILAAGHADRWFFIRYNDPHLHLRLRFHGDPKRLSSEVLPKLWEYANPEIQRGTLWRVQLDTYEREIVRYGGLEGIEIAERFFHLDSELVLELLSTLRLSANPAARWQSACYSVDRLLSGLGFNTNEKRQIVNKSGKYYEKNFSVDQRYKKQISDKFRNERSTLEKIVAGSEELDTFPPGIHYAIAAYAERIKTIRADLEAKSATGELTQPISEMASSYVHMHLNRLFRSAQNAQEMVIYDFLARTYDSKMAKEKRER